ncbi:hypothetical protein RND81_01G042000 [Saponaria officinalis]|uniref:Peptidase A1 domain-containing protein n=1 Tax=Saponaria officinalis TaxID=3572 RepID=A0AAW1N8S5_SAPOF
MSIIKLNLNFLIFTLLCVFSQKSYSNNNTIIGGLQLRMIHIDSPNSPIYQPELSDVERANRLIDISDSRIYYLSKKTANKNMSFDLKPDTSNVRVFKHGFLYYVEIGIGTFPSESPKITYAQVNYFVFDTRSNLIWTQCEDCKECFYQKSPRFARSKLKTYHLVPCNECPECRCENGIATIVVRCGGGAKMKGIMSRDSFTFGPVTESSGERVGGLRFTCATHIQNFKTGIPTLLNFGNYIITRDYMFVTPILTRPNLFQYYVTINDIGVNGQKLNIPSHLFALNPDNSGGTVFDSGASFNYLVPDAFDIVVEAIANYISKNNLYIRKNQGRDINLDASEGVPQPGLYCLTIRRNEVHQPLNVLGTFAQINQRLIFDLAKSELSFIAEDCSVARLT